MALGAGRYSLPLEHIEPPGRANCVAVMRGEAYLSVPAGEALYEKR